MPRDFSLARSSVCHWENTIHNSNGLCLASDEVPKLHIHSDEAGKRKGAMPWLSSTLLSEKLSTYSTVPNRLTSEQAVSLLPSFHIVDELFSILHPIALEKENDIRIKNTYSTFFITTGFLCRIRKAVSHQCSLARRNIPNRCSLYVFPVGRQIWHHSFTTHVYETGILQKTGIFSELYTIFHPSSLFVPCKQQ